MFGISRYKLLSTKYINSKVLLYSTGNYIQSLVINRYEKEYIYILLCCTSVTNTTQQINSTSIRNKTLVFGKFDAISLSILTILCRLSVTGLSL